MNKNIKVKGEIYKDEKRKKRKKKRRQKLTWDSELLAGLASPLPLFKL